MNKFKALLFFVLVIGAAVGVPAYFLVNNPPQPPRPETPTRTPAAAEDTRTPAATTTRTPQPEPLTRIGIITAPAPGLVNFRADANDDAYIILVFNSGTVVNYSGSSGDWIKINYSGNSGYVHINYIILEKSKNE